MKIKSNNILVRAAAVLLTTCSVSSQAAVINWADWQASQNDQSGFTAQASITTATSTVNIDYSNANGVAFFQDGTGIDYFADRQGLRDASTSPFTSAFVENIPTAAEMIALRFAGMQSLVFSETIANPVFSYVSLNSNGYSFDQDFEILSFGNASDGNACGYWGCGTSYKDVVDLGNGQFEYRLLGTGEPHGTIRFTGAFDSVSWTSLSSENWNGFTVGIEGTAEEVFAASAPTTIALIAFGVFGLSLRNKRK